MKRKKIILVRIPQLTRNSASRAANDVLSWPAFGRPRTFNMGGPDNVRANLINGLQIIGESSEERGILRSLLPTESPIGVLSGQLLLGHLARARRKGRIGRLVVGPNVVMDPAKIPRAVRDQIHVVVTPSDWVSQQYVESCPDLENRVRTWAAGIDTRWWDTNIAQGEDECHQPPPRSDQVLIYVKHTPYAWIEKCTQALIESCIAFKIIRYGDYSPESYRTLLRESQAIIWLSPSESQGLALAEAWSCGVPSLCADSPTWRKAQIAIYRDSRGAPYLDEDTGTILYIDEPVRNQIDDFLQRLPVFSPRTSSETRFSLEVTARNYVSLFE